MLEEMVITNLQVMLAPAVEALVVQGALVQPYQMLPVDVAVPYCFHQ